MKRPLLIRAILIAAVAVLILFPIALIEGKVSERRARAEGVERQFAAETSAAQVVAGPLLALTCEETYVEERQVMRAGKAETLADRKTGPCPTVYFPPRSLRVTGSLPVETRHRGIYPIRIYRSSLALAGEFAWPPPAVAHGANPRVWKQAYIVMAVSDPRGIKAITSSRATALAGAARGEGGLAQFAVREDLGEHKARQAGDNVAFDYRMELVGTSSLHVAPVGDTTEIRLASDWPHPSFGGSWSPDERRISAAGFEGAWRTTHVASGGQAYWNKRAGEGSLASPAGAAGVRLVDPVNVYALSYRATEYAFLFILFTFAALALAEVTAGVKLHPVQYGLVGSALAVFFLLLVALSEHIAFAAAYAAAASACVLLLTFYLRHPLGTPARTAAFFGMFVALYSALFVLLKSEDHALLMGSVMVFSILAMVMVATRRLDWGAVASGMRAQRGPA